MLFKFDQIFEPFLCQFLGAQIYHFNLPLLFLYLLRLAIKCLHRYLLLIFVPYELLGPISDGWLHFTSALADNARFLPNLVYVVLAGV